MTRSLPKTATRLRATALVAAAAASLGLAAGCATEDDLLVDQDPAAAEASTLTGEHAFPNRSGEIVSRTVRTPEGTQDVQVEQIDGFEIYQGDIVLSEPGEAGVRAVGINAAGRWPNGVIPYVIDGDLPNHARVTDAIAAWEAATSVNFVPRTTQTSYIHVISDQGCSSRLGKVGGEQFVRLTSRETVGSVAGIAIAQSTDHVYYWYRDGFATSGTSSDANFYRPHYKYTLPPGRTPAQIVDIAIASNDHVYAWYTDGTVSSGTSDNLDAYIPPYSYRTASGKAIGDIAGIGIASNDKVYTWYKDGTVSVGNTGDLDALEAAHPFKVAAGETFASILAVDIAGSNDHVYAWYSDGNASSGQSKDLDSYRTLFDFDLPGNCGLGATIHELGHTLGLAHEQNRHDRDDHVTIHLENVTAGYEHDFNEVGSNFDDKGVYDFDSIMHYGSFDFSKNGQPTITKKDGSTFAAQRLRVSTRDAAAINAMY